MATHPLVERSQSKEVRSAKGFREAAAALTGETLAAELREEMAAAPRRADAGKKYLVAYNRRLAAERKPGRDSEHAALALVARGEPLRLPGEVGFLQPVAAAVPLRSAPADKARGPDDPNFGVGSVDLLGVGPDERLAVGTMRFLAPDARRVGTGETPLRALLEGLVHLAVVEANRDVLAAELEGRLEKPLAPGMPVLLLVGSPRYWELCRKREAQKGAAWIREMERLAAELEEHAGVQVLYLSLALEGDPSWTYEEGGPRLVGTPRLRPAWESGAGRIRPKPKPRTRRKSATEPEDALVEPDLSRPVRPYAVTERYEPGDRIEHPTLGLGVVQGAAGPTKIRVLFDGRKSLLVHDRPPSGGA
ncbi:MAG: hypothetical protein R3263_06640 [Myxococcota bacterium]|nr:hypothetical protein [Myxococcota bacterium]